MSKTKEVVVAAALAFAINNLCMILFLAGIIIGQWLLYPAIMLSPQYGSNLLLNDATFYLAGYFQYFILFWCVIRLISFLKTLRNNNK